MSCFTSDLNFCPECGNILPLPGLQDTVRCPRCSFSIPVAGTGHRPLTSSRPAGVSKGFKLTVGVKVCVWTVACLLALQWAGRCSQYWRGFSPGLPDVCHRVGLRFSPHLNPFVKFVGIILTLFPCVLGQSSTASRFVQQSSWTLQRSPQPFWRMRTLSWRDLWWDSHRLGPNAVVCGGDSADSCVLLQIDRRCVRCNKEGMVYHARQMRSADEGQTIFFTCIHCRWSTTPHRMFSYRCCCVIHVWILTLQVSGEGGLLRVEPWPLTSWHRWRFTFPSSHESSLFWGSCWLFIFYISISIKWRTFLQSSCDSRRSEEIL